VSKEYSVPDKFEKMKRSADKQQKIKKSNVEFRPIKNASVFEYEEYISEDDDFVIEY